jgi:DNA-binding response OmpR family regulator
VFRAIKALFATTDSFDPRHRQRETRVAVVALLRDQPDRKLLDSICHEHDWVVHFAESCQGAAEAAKELEAPIILCDRDLPGTEWRPAVQTLAASPSGACVILISSVLDEYLRSEVGLMNGYDVLAKPLREDDVVRAIKLAWAYWKQCNHKLA